MNGPARIETVARLQLATGAGLLLFWALFYTVGLAPKSPPPGYFAFEHSFTVPDIILAVSFILSGMWLQSSDASRRELGRSLSLVCAGALMFLGALDISFNLQNGMFSSGWVDALFVAAINAWCIGFGAFTAYELGFQSGHGRAAVGTA